LLVEVHLVQLSPACSLIRMFRASEIYGRDHPSPALDAYSSDTYGRDHPSLAPEASSSAAYGGDNPSPAPEASSSAGKGTPGSWETTNGSEQVAGQSWSADSSFGESTWNAGSSSWTLPPKHVPPPPGAVDGGATSPDEGTQQGKGQGKGTADKGAQVSGGAVPTTITLHGEGVSAAGKQVISDACQKVATDGGFSVPEQILVPHHSCAHVVFPHLSAAMEFFQATNGMLSIGGKFFHVRPPRGQPQAGGSTQLQQEARQGETPTDTLVIRGIGDMTTRQLGEAFAHLTPRLKRVKIHTDKAGKSKGLGWVTFEEIEEADLVLQRLKQEGCMLAGRRVSVNFHEPSTMEGMIELEARKKRSLESIEASHTRALKGVNSEMWANYLAMFQQPQSEEPSPKFVKSETDNATMPDLRAESAEAFASGTGTLGGSMQPQFPVPARPQYSWLALS